MGLADRVAVLVVLADAPSVIVGVGEEVGEADSDEVEVVEGLEPKLKEGVGV